MDNNKALVNVNQLKTAKELKEDKADEYLDELKARIDTMMDSTSDIDFKIRLATLQLELIKVVSYY